MPRREPPSRRGLFTPFNIIVGVPLLLIGFTIIAYFFPFPPRSPLGEITNAILGAIGVKR